MAILKSRNITNVIVLLRFLVLASFIVGGVGCDAGGKKTRIIVPADLQGLVGGLLKTGAAAGSSGDSYTAKVRPYEAETPLTSLNDNGDIVVIWWSKAVSDSFEAGDLSLVPMEEIAPEEVWPFSLLEFLRTTSGVSDGLIGLPLSIDPWIMVWNRRYLAEGGAPSPLWEAITKTSGPIIGLAGSDRDARLGWVALLADAYPSPGGPASFAPWRNGLRRFAQGQAEGMFQRASFSYPWSDATVILTRGDVGAILAPLSLYRSLEVGDQATLEVRRPPDALGRSDFPLIADVLLAVVRSGSFEKPGVPGTLRALANAGSQRILADHLGTIPARIDAQVRDGAAFTAVRIARTAAYFLPLPSAVLSPEVTTELSDLSLLLLRNPSIVDDLLAEHGL